MTARDDWTVIPLPGLAEIQVTSDGRVRRVPQPREYSTWISGIGREMVSVTTSDGTKAAYTVHRLVALAFLPQVDGREHVNHKNGNRLDNRVENLEWVTPKENLDHAVVNKLYAQGKRHPWYKIDVEEASAMRREGKSLAEIGVRFGASLQAVRAALAKVGALWPDREWTGRQLGGRRPKVAPRVPNTRKIDLPLALEMRAAGASYAKIARRFDASASSVQALLKRHSVRH